MKMKFAGPSAHWACKITGSLFVGCFVVPPYPPGSPGPSHTVLSMMVVTPGNDFFGQPKNHQNINPSKINFFLIWASCGGALCPHFVDLGVQKWVLGGHFQFFFYVFFDMDFGAFFTKKTKKWKNEKVGFDWKKTILSWRSPCPKKSKEDMKKTTKKNVVF